MIKVRIRFTLTLIQAHFTRQRLLMAALLAVSLALILPGTSEAHAILLRSTPAPSAVLSTAPVQVQMWFTEAINPVASTAAVVNSANQRVDRRDAFVSPFDATEMDVSLQPNLSPGVYAVVWRTDSADDGHVLIGSFQFTIARPDGSIPTLSAGTVLGQHVLGGSTTTGQDSGQLDGLTLFNLLMITLVELGAVFWVGAQFWPIFVLLPSAEDHEELSVSNQQIQQRFERRFSLPTLLLLLLANGGVLFGQALSITGGNVADALAPTLLASLLTNGRFGTFWIVRVIVILLALRLSLYQLQWHRSRRGSHPRLVNTILPWANLLLGMALFIAMAMSSHASAVSGNTGVLALVVDWFHLIAAALWVGGMLYIATSYLPVLQKSAVVERVRSLVTVLPYYTPWALAGVVMLAVTGPLSATIEVKSWEQLFATAYGRTLIVKVFLVAALLVTSAIHVFVLRPQLRKEARKYAYAASRLQTHQAINAPSPTALLVGQAHLSEEQQAVEAGPALESQSSPSQTQETTQSDRIDRAIAQQVKLRERRLSQRSGQLMRVLRWEPVLGVAVLVCVGLLNVFGGTLSPTTAAQQPVLPTGTAAPYHTTVKTTDSTLSIALYLNPNSAGPNGLQVSVADARTGAPVTNVEVSVSATILDMDMGTQAYTLQPDGKGHFSGTINLLMSGHWQLRVQVRTHDKTLHEAIVKVTTPF